MPTYLSLNRLWKRSGLKYFAPFYHTVSNNKLAHIWPLYQTVGVEEFESHLDKLTGNFDFVSANEFLDFVLKGDKNNKKPKALLSFDDGLVECHDVVLPILQKKGIPAVFFINPDFVDTEEIFYRYKIAIIINEIHKGQLDASIIKDIREELGHSKKLKYTIEESLLSLDSSDSITINNIVRLSSVKYRNSDIYMNSKHINNLVSEGHSIGAHSLNHPNFELMELQECLDQIKLSLDFCQNRFNQSLRLFAFPFYDYNLPNKIFESMYDELKVDLSFGTSGFKKDVFDRSIQRFPMEELNYDLIPHIKKELIYYFIKKFVGKHVMKRKQ